MRDLTSSESFNGGHTTPSPLVILPAMLVYQLSAVGCVAGPDIYNSAGAVRNSCQAGLAGLAATALTVTTD